MSILFDDITFPTELYDQTNGGFSHPIKSLLLFAPRVLDQHAPPTKAAPAPVAAAAASQSAWPVKTALKVGLEVAGEIARAALRSRETSSGRERPEVKSTAKETARVKTAGKEKGQAAGKSQAAGAPDAESEEEDAKKNLQKKEPEPEPDGCTAVAVATGALLSTLAVVAAYQASKAHGHASFHSSFRDCLASASEALASTRAWCAERRALQLPVPDLVTRDVAKLAALVDALEKVDMGEGHDNALVPVWIGCGAAATLCASALFGFVGGPATLAATAAFRVGAAGMFAACAWGAVVKGRYSAKVYEESLKMVAARGQGLVGEMERVDRGPAVLRALRLEEVAEVGAPPPVAVPSGKPPAPVVEGEARRRPRREFEADRVLA
ncbi:hypothetical protein BDK51DRAFT_48415 [Blyttiomyces helicus]|uniref:Uncharacterized protein n=1 Tax=Blyttiomyces helicus TaxID=388810 RepID=A0A4P9VYZ2_9FUNG|nr:hypothetical protein BDK51DRAFT_48415 [Blyttiomyces helicus]|eukprot:RKO85019.1 hypothetical protein BDK51DRAFT_48415 [Blyttiomyces helicus]